MKKINAYVISNIGNERPSHEDNFYIPKNRFIDEGKQKEIKTPKDIVEFEFTGSEGVFVVCDGMGGHNAGEVASRLAVETIAKRYDEILTDDKDKLLDFIKKLNNYICEYSEKNVSCNNMGSTFSGLIFFKDKNLMLHVGDSKILRVEKDGLKQISKNHNEGTRLVEAGILKKEDLLNFPNRKALYKYLGRKGNLVADCEEIECDGKNRFLISSDGLTDALSEKEILEVITKSDTPKATCTNLLNECLKKGTFCSDNVTIICIDFE